MSLEICCCLRNNCQRFWSVYGDTTRKISLRCLPGDTRLAKVVEFSKMQSSRCAAVDHSGHVRTHGFFIVIVIQCQYKIPTSLLQLCGLRPDMIKCEATIAHLVQKRHQLVRLYLGTCLRDGNYGSQSWRKPRDGGKLSSELPDI